MKPRIRNLFLCGVTALPAMLLGFSSGPPLQRTGAAADGGQNCTACHTSNPVNSGDGRVTITAANYVPGQTQTIRVRVEHPTAMRWGFEITSRLAGDPAKAAGSFRATPDIRVLCFNASAPPCAVDQPYFATHTSASTNAGTSGGRTWEIEWTPPATDVGPIIFYAAGNAANNNGFNTGDFIYTTSVTISSTGARPSISEGGIGDAFNFRPSIASNSWVAIFGQNLASTTQDWESSIVDGVLPTSVAGVSVRINNRPAPIYFVSPGQINVLAPLDDATGPVPVVVTNADGESAPVNVMKFPAAPAFYAPGTTNGRLYVTAVAAQLDQSGNPVYLGKTGADVRVTRAARPGETILVFGTGFGATQPERPTDRVVSAPAELTRKPMIYLNDLPVDFPTNGFLVSSGLYQFNITVPASLAAGDYPIVADIGGVRSTPVYLAVAP